MGRDDFFDFLDFWIIYTAGCVETFKNFIKEANLTDCFSCGIFFPFIVYQMGKVYKLFLVSKWNGSFKTDRFSPKNLRDCEGS